MKFYHGRHAPGSAFLLKFIGTSGSYFVILECPRASSDSDNVSNSSSSSSKSDDETLRFKTGEYVGEFIEELPEDDEQDWDENAGEGGAGNAGDLMTCCWISFKH